MRSALLLASVLALGSPALRALPGVRNAETVSVALGGVVPVGEAYDGFWTMQPGLALRGAMDFYGGEAHAALQAFTNEGRSEDLPDFLALHGEIGWGPRIGLPAGLRLTPSARVGALTMRFSEAERFVGALQNETELTAGLGARLDAPVAGPVRAFVAAEWTHVYTAVPIHLTFAQVGLSATFRSPAWLRRALR